MATLCSVFASSPNALLSFFDFLDATKYRLVCRDAHAAVAAYPWGIRIVARASSADNEERRVASRELQDLTPIRSLRRWRACFPHARVAKLAEKDVCDADFEHLAGVRMLDMSDCSKAGITDAAFAHLAGIHTLDMTGCSQATITDAPFALLADTHTLKWY